jgi:hypothetical protein
MEVMLDTFAIKISDVALLLIDFDLRFYLACEEMISYMRIGWMTDQGTWCFTARGRGIWCLCITGICGCGYYVSCDD